MQFIQYNMVNKKYDDFKQKLLIFLIVLGIIIFKIYIMWKFALYCTFCTGIIFYGMSTGPIPENEVLPYEQADI